MAKRRVYELAKDYGMKGPEFVRVLKDLGFDKVKTHMAVLDDADQMVIEVRLGAAGYEKKVEAASPVKKKAVVRKKAIRKKSTTADTATAVAEEAPAPSTGSPIRRKTPAAEPEAAPEAPAAEAEAPADAPTAEESTEETKA